MRAPGDLARVAIGAIRAQGRRALLALGWADLALIDDRDDCLAVGEVNQQAPFRRALRLDGRQGASIWCGHRVFTHNLVKISAMASRPQDS
jgi:vancomycin aglycone glucosyltransferase